MSIISVSLKIRTLIEHDVSECQSVKQASSPDSRPYVYVRLIQYCVLLLPTVIIPHYVYQILVSGRTAIPIFPNGSTALVGQGLLIVETSRSHSDTPHSVGLPWTSDQPVAETST